MSVKQSVSYPFPPDQQYDENYNHRRDHHIIRSHQEQHRQRTDCTDQAVDPAAGILQLAQEQHYKQRCERKVQSFSAEGDHAAQQTAEGIVNDANENAERIRNEADAKAREVIRQALTEKQAELEEIDRLKASREEFKAEYLKLIQHFMDDAQNSFPADLMASTPVGSAASPAVTVPAAEPLPVADPVVPVADPFAPIDNFAADDLD